MARISLALALAAAAAVLGARAQWPNRCSGDGSMSCMAGHTCGKNGFSGNGLGCCPFPNAVSCPNGFACCPSGTACVPMPSSGVPYNQVRGGRARQRRARARGQVGPPRTRARRPARWRPCWREGNDCF